MRGRGIGFPFDSGRPKGGILRHPGDFPKEFLLALGELPDHGPGFFEKSGHAIFFFTLFFENGGDLTPGIRNPRRGAE